MTDEKEKKGKWEDLVFGAIEKIASAPSKLKDPKESVTQAVEWVKGVRDDIQDKVTKEVMERIRQIDWNATGKKVAEHIAENFDIEVSAKVSFKPKANRKKSHVGKTKGNDDI